MARARLPVGRALGADRRVPMEPGLLARRPQAAPHAENEALVYSYCHGLKIAIAQLSTFVPMRVYCYGLYSYGLYSSGLYSCGSGSGSVRTHTSVQKEVLARQNEALVYSYGL